MVDNGVRSYFENYFFRRDKINEIDLSGDHLKSFIEESIKYISGLEGEDIKTTLLVTKDSDHILYNNTTVDPDQEDNRVSCELESLTKGLWDNARQVELYIERPGGSMDILSWSLSDPTKLTVYKNP